MSVEFILVVPGLLALPGAAFDAASALASLAHHAPPPRVERRGVAAALVEALRIPAETPLAPLAALGAGIDVGNDYVLHADPVHLAADRDDVVLLRRVDDLGADAARALTDTLDRHFAADGLRFVAPRPDAWFARRADAPDLATTPFDAAHRRGLFANLPTGADAGTWRRWQNEIEMLLHEHPVNVAREAKGLVAANGIWFWGGGRLADVGPLPGVVVVAPPGRIGDVARGIAQRGHGAAAWLQPEDHATNAIGRAAANAVGTERVSVIAVLPAIDGANDVASLETRWLSPALRDLAHNRIEAIHLIADGNGAAAMWRVSAPTLWRRALARMRRKAFVAPSPPEP